MKWGAIYWDCSEVEVITVEVSFLLVFVSMLADVEFQSLFLDAQVLNILSSNAVSLTWYALVERQVLDVWLLGRNWNISVSHFFLHGGLLSNQVNLSLQGHANLSQLEHDFEEDKEWGHVSSSCWVGDFLEERSFLLIQVHVHILSDLLDPRFLKSRSISFLDSGSEVIGILENWTMGGVFSIGVGGGENADKIKDLSGSVDSWACAFWENWFDLLKSFCINGLSESSLMLVHGDEQLVQVTELLASFTNLLSLFTNTSLDWVKLVLGSVLLGLNLYGKNGGKGEWVFSFEK